MVVILTLSEAKGKDLAEEIVTHLGKVLGLRLRMTGES
jgi:hypothetical protein